MKTIQKKLNWKFRTFVLITLLIGAYTDTHAQIISKTIEKTENLPIGTSIEINTDYDISYKTWDKQTIKVIYKINIEAKTSDEANSFYAEIENSLKKDLSNIKNGKLSLKIPLKKFVQNGSNNIKIKLTNNRTYKLKKYELSAIVYAPKSNNLKLQSSFHDVNIDDLDADANIIVNSSHLKMGNCKKLELHANFSKDIILGEINNAKISLHSSKIKNIGNEVKNLDLRCHFSDFSLIKQVDNAKVLLHSSNIELGYVKNLELYADFARNIRIKHIENLSLKKLHSSNLEVDIVNNLNANNISFSKLNSTEISNCNIHSTSSSRYNIDKLDNIKIDHASFSNFKVDELSKNFTCQSNSGSVYINKVKSNFKEIKIDGSFVRIDIKCEPETNFKFFAKLSFPRHDIKNVTYTNFDSTPNSLNLEGQRGKETNSTIKLDCNNCNISLN